MLTTRQNPSTHKLLIFLPWEKRLERPLLSTNHENFTQRKQGEITTEKEGRQSNLNYHKKQGGREGLSLPPPASRILHSRILSLFSPPVLFRLFTIVKCQVLLDDFPLLEPFRTPSSPPLSSPTKKCLTFGLIFSKIIHYLKTYINNFLLTVRFQYLVFFVMVFL